MFVDCNAPNYALNSTSCTEQAGVKISMKQPERSHPRRTKGERRLGAVGAIVMATLLMIAISLRALHKDESPRQFSRFLKTAKHSHFQQAVSTLDFAEFSCDNLYSHTMDKASRCAFAQTCNDGDGIFAPIVYCSQKYSTRFLVLCLGPPLAIFLIILFRILGSTAEEFFSPGLEMMSLEMGLPERFAGVTLLALGNGAPDVASTVNAILNDRKLGYKMALGELTGTAMVGSTVIVGAVTFVANGVSCRGALVRDVIMFILTMIVVYMAFHDGTISMREIHFFLFLYLGYVLVVLAADVYHRKVVRPRILMRQKSSEVEEAGETTALVTAADSRDRRSYSVGAWEDPHKKKEDYRRYRSDEIGRHEASQIGSLERVIEAFSNYDVGGNGDIAASERSANGEEETSDRTASGWGQLEMDGSEPLMVFHPHHGGIVDLKHGERIVESSHHLEGVVEMDEVSALTAAPAPQSWTEAFATAGPELSGYFRKFWRETYYNDDYNVVDKFLMTCELPFMIARMLTIPVPCDGYYCRPLIALSIALSPLWLWYYFWDQFDVNIMDTSTVTIFSIFFFPFLLGLMVLRFAPCGDVPPRLSVAVPITLIGFCLSATWLDLVADMLVSLLSFFGIICRIPSTIMGLTVLAWGNSSQDMIANMTVARKGLSTMAITASFAGPVFNILIGLGLGLGLLYGMGKPGEPIVVELNNPLRLGFLFSVLSGALTIFCGVCIGRGFLPKGYGYVALVLYFAYAMASLTL